MRFCRFGCALFGLLLLACGRTNLIGSPGRTNDAGEVPDATSTGVMPSVRDASLPDASAPDAAEAWDGCGIVDAGDMVQDGGYGTPGWKCTIPAEARSSTTCQIVGNQYAGCGPTEYALFCSEELDASSLGCRSAGEEIAPIRRYDYCCSCEGTDAATGCVNVDVSTYDRSCSKDSDCMFIGAGMWCPGACNCAAASAAINRNGEACYEQTLARVALNGDCNCPLWPGSLRPVCQQGICTIPNAQ